MSKALAELRVNKCYNSKILTYLNNLSQKEIADGLEKTERSIWDLEESYFDATPAGNFMKGFEHYVDTKPLNEKKRDRIASDQRWFSYSSWTYSGYVSCCVNVNDLYIP